MLWWKNCPKLDPYFMFNGGSKRDQAQFDEALDPLYLQDLWLTVRCCRCFHNSIEYTLVYKAQSELTT